MQLSNKDTKIVVQALLELQEGCLRDSKYIGSVLEELWGCIAHKSTAVLEPRGIELSIEGLGLLITKYQQAVDTTPSKQSEVKTLLEDITYLTTMRDYFQSYNP